MSDKTFEWNDALVVEFITWSINSSPLYQGRYKDLEDFKKSKEKDIPKNWEILSVSQENGSGWSCDKNIFDWYLKNHNYVINQVKRLSDGEVFTVGERYSYGKEGILTAFRIAGTREMLCDIEFDKTNLYSNAPLRAIDKVKPKVPLFTTEDGVEIFDPNCEVFGVNKDFDCYNKLTVKSFPIKNTDWIWFSSKYKRDEYILNNKPIEVSFSDLHKFIRSHEHGTSINAIHDYFKSKLKL